MDFILNLSFAKQSCLVFKFQQQYYCYKNNNEKTRHVCCCGETYIFLCKMCFYTLRFSSTPIYWHSALTLTSAYGKFKTNTMCSTLAYTTFRTIPSCQIKFSLISRKYVQIPVRALTLIKENIRTTTLSATKISQTFASSHFSEK